MVAPIIFCILIALTVLIILIVAIAVAINATRNIRANITDPTPIPESAIETPTICKRTFTFQRTDDNVHDWQMIATSVCQSGSLIN
jgi:hypothetical protein